MKTKRSDRGAIRDTSTTFLITVSQKERLQAIADKRGLTMSALIRMAINEYLGISEGEHDD